MNCIYIYLTITNIIKKQIFYQIIYQILSNSIYLYFQTIEEEGKKKTKIIYLFIYFIHPIYYETVTKTKSKMSVCIRTTLNKLK